jgi:hypothetical protein
MAARRERDGSKASSSDWNVINGVEEYIREMINQVGLVASSTKLLKILIVDEETMGIISMVMGLSSLLESDILRVERIDAEKQKDALATDTRGQVSAIAFLRPTRENQALLKTILKSPSYGTYHLFFSNAVSQEMMDKLAEFDVHDVVGTVQEVYADVYPINNDLFSLNVPSALNLNEEDLSFARIVEGLVSACLTLQILPAIRYNKKSLMAKKVAKHLQRRLKELKEESDVLNKLQSSQKRGEPVLLLMDRRNDPVTPLMHQWTYQAMIHELLQWDNNRINLSRDRAVDDDPELRQIVMATSQDQFFADNYLSFFPETITSIDEENQKFKKETSNLTGQDADVRGVVAKFPEFRLRALNVKKHTEVAQLMQSIVDRDGLFESGHLEQEIACKESLAEQKERLLTVIRGSAVSKETKLRLVFLFALRYEQQDPAAIRQLKDELGKKDLTRDEIKQIDQVLHYGGVDQRSGDLFQNRTAGARGLNWLGGAWNAGISEVTAAVSSGSELAQLKSEMLQHKSLTGNSADQLMRGALDEKTYPFLEKGGQASDKPFQAIIFVIGGTTFAESRDVSNLNTSLGGTKVILGGTMVHNSTSFLEEVSQLSQRVVE